ncbi:hypothetical protein [Mesorhizobium sp. dw_380]|uniref:hypothetical protein n=1 Tax=Mesorhizobium sp. dw_380 TaxID=2812001 RepID=UPI001BDF259D|nr:hypothetical protein [Mesorhizobium sp. dw_380]
MVIGDKSCWLCQDSGGNWLIGRAMVWCGLGPEGATLMTMPSPILATAFVTAMAAILALRAAIVAVSLKSMVKVPSQRHPAKHKNPRLR